MRYLCGFLLLLLLAGSLPAHADGGYGIVRGTVRFAGGAAFPRVKVTIEVSGKAISLTAGDDGTFIGLAPAGTGRALTTWTETPITIIPGEVTPLAITVTPTVGVLLTITGTDSTPFTGAVVAAARPAAGQKDEKHHPLPLGGGQYWLPEVAPTDRELAVRATLHGSVVQGSALQRFTFPEEAPLRQVTMTVPVAAPVVLTIVDIRGTPLVNTAVVGLLACDVPDEFTFWPEDADKSTYTDTDLQRLAQPCRTDEEGRLALGKLVPQRYALTLATANAEGARTSFEVKADGTCTLTSYPVRANRQVVQTLFRPDGTPARKIEAYASFCQAGRVAIRRAVSDTDGRVTWANLPHARVIVAGPAITPGVIPAEGEQFTTPLPAPAAQGTRKFRVDISVTGKEPVSVATILRSGAQVNSRRLVARLGGQITGTSATETWEATAGAPFTLFWGANFTPLQARLLDGAYLPYLDDDVATIDLPMADLPFTEFTGLTVSGRVLTADGAQATANGLQVTPAEGNTLYSLLQAGRMPWLLRPTVQPDGTFTASLPPTGAYEFRLSGAIPQTITVTENAPRPPVELRMRRR